MVKVVLGTDGSVLAEPKSGAYTLDEMQQAVGGYIEIISAYDASFPLVLVMDEEGKIKGRPSNAAATAIAHRCGMISADDWIAGNALAATASEDGEIMPLRQAELEALGVLSA